MRSPKRDLESAFDELRILAVEIVSGVERPCVCRPRTNAVSRPSRPRRQTVARGMSAKYTTPFESTTMPYPTCRACQRRTRQPHQQRNERRLEEPPPSQPAHAHLVAMEPLGEGPFRISLSVVHVQLCCGLTYAASAASGESATRSGTTLSDSELDVLQLLNAAKVVWSLGEKVRRENLLDDAVHHWEGEARPGASAFGL
jgi:hypothetical protein